LFEEGLSITMTVLNSGWERSFEQTLFSALDPIQQPTESKMAAQVEFAILGQSSDTTT
jgi:hypothetical protein